ncbi:MAG TPA: prephenate dehydratase [Caulobacteraceae bacterium]|jgi:prephenate dehydratase|nr:prephenate dehydratase [Caulobacteraceae bacterium]
MTGRPKIAFQGELGSFSHEACTTYFPDHAPTPFADFELAVAAVRSRSCELGMIPVENSTAGRVPEMHHLLPESGLKIIGERFKPIHFQLMANQGAPLDGLKSVTSMPIALNQCRKLIRRLKLRAVAGHDTAGSAKLLAEHPDPSRAVLAAAPAAELYGLAILERDVEDEAHNTTRFLVMTGERHPPAPPPGASCVTSFVFRVRNLPAALYKAMGGFATNGVNMTKLESYMENGAFTATFFYSEVDGRPDDPALVRAFEELNFFSDHVEVLGVYPADPFRAKAA